MFSIILVCTIIRDVYLFNKGQYNPYPFRKSDKELPFIVTFFISLSLIWIAVYVLSKNIKLLTTMSIIFLCYSFCLIFCVNILNYLSHKKIKDKTIISQTVKFNIMVIVISIGIWKHVLMK